MALGLLRSLLCLINISDQRNLLVEENNNSFFHDLSKPNRPFCHSHSHILAPKTLNGRSGFHVLLRLCTQQITRYHILRNDTCDTTLKCKISYRVRVNIRGRHKHLVS